MTPPGPDAGGEADGDPATVVRVYSDGQRTGVRDPRTGVTVGNVRAVLEEGRIDAFILASLSRTGVADPVPG